MPYYKSLSQTVKDQALAGWKDSSIECIVATIAFGMVSFRCLYVTSAYSQVVGYRSCECKVHYTLSDAKNF